MKVTFITTVGHNIGDDFVRDGIKYLLESSLEEDIEYQYIHKHIPVTVRHGFDKVRSLRWSERIEKYLPIGLGRDKIFEADIVIQSGAPLYWLHSDRIASYNTEWYEPLIKNRFSGTSSKKLLNIGVGACQDYFSNGGEFLESPKFTSFVRSFADMCQLTTVRDQLSIDLLSNLGVKAYKLPCPSIFSLDYHLDGGVAAEKEFVALNFMNGGGHYDFENKIDNEKWLAEFSKFYKSIKDQERFVWVCHNSSEVDFARRIDANAQVFFSEKYEDYIKLYSKAKFGVVNRVHAAFQMASAFAPSLIVGSDSRARMASEIGLESLFVNDITADILFSKFKSLQESHQQYQKEIIAIKNEAIESYKRLLREAIYEKAVNN